MIVVVNVVQAMITIILFYLVISGVPKAFALLAGFLREFAATRHQRNLELAYAANGHPLPGGYPCPCPPAESLPAAVFPAPPGAWPAWGATAGPCRHEHLKPVLDVDGELLRWVCANHDRCDGEFDKSVALYAPEKP